MSIQSRNIAVGLTVLVALGLLGGIILIFAGMPQALQGGYQIRIHMADSGGAKSGDSVTLRGLLVGKVTVVDFAGADPRQGVDLVVHISKGVKLPLDTRAYISQGLMGGTSISLATGGGGESFLPTDNSATVPGYISGLDLGKLAQSMESMAQGIGTLLGTSSPGPGAVATTAPGTGPAAAPTNLQTTIARLDVTLGALNAMLTDKENQQNIKGTLAELKVFTANGALAMEAIRKLAVEGQTTVAEATKTVRTIDKATTRASDNINDLSQAILKDTDRLTQGLLKDTEDVSRAMNSLDRAIAALSSGQGTTGKLINDPHLYNNLVDVIDQMSAMLKDTREMLKQWKEKGVPLKLK